MNETFEMVAKTLYGLEDILAGELLSLGAKDIVVGRRMVSYTGDKELLYKSNFCCRTALRILKPIYHFKANDADTVYKEAKKVEWESFMSLDKTFAIDSVIYSEDFNHSKFVAYRTKDAIADYFMEKFQKRPSVRVTDPDLLINIHISHNDCTLSIDSSGESLHKRGYRIDQTEAPLNEVLAAGMIMRTGWKGESNFVDPMCGSGTLLIEAAMIALNIAPGIHRKAFAFEKWVDFDQELLDRIYNDDSQEREFKFKCYGSDISPAAIDIADKNIHSAGLAKYIELKVQPFQQMNEAPKPGILVTNPPYGERISVKDLLGLYTMIGERLKHVFMGYNAWILSYKDECFDKIGLHPKEKMKLMNGSLECQYNCYEMFEGTNRDFKTKIASSPNGRPQDRGQVSDRNNFKREYNNDHGKRPYNDYRNDRPKRSFDESEDIPANVPIDDNLPVGEQKFHPVKKHFKDDDDFRGAPRKHFDDKKFDSHKFDNHKFGGGDKFASKKPFNKGKKFHGKGYDED